MTISPLDASTPVHSTTVISVRRGQRVAMGSDGQVTMGTTVMKTNARKVRSLYKGQVLAGFAGATADAFALFERFESKIEQWSGNLSRAAVELAKDWRSDRILRRFDAILAVADKEQSLIITGGGDVIEPADGLIAIGSGGPYALAAARALMDNTAEEPASIVEKSLKIAGDICIYTNSEQTIEQL